MNKYIYGTLIERENYYERWSFNGKAVFETRSYELIDCLNLLGEDGWELVMYDEKNSEYIFKKRIK